MRNMTFTWACANIRMGESSICVGGRNVVFAVSSVSHNKTLVQSCTTVSSEEIHFQTNSCKADINNLR